jgi:tetratricopeptide (TPR) repeat protein
MGEKKFRAFISYSHADEAWASWLQRSLERFRAPGSLAKILAAQGKPARLSPVFRDREDLPVAGSLNSAIQAALADSEFQIVICSPRGAKSRWVNEEIKYFHRIHGPGRVFALIVDGEPGASNIPGRENEECFPRALRFALTADGEETAERAEPLAADARKVGDGKRYALLKVAAGMLGVGLDDLIRRDAVRRARQAWAVTGASLVGMAGAGALAFYAVAKGNEATTMRGKAEDLIEFMLTDLKDKLEPVGRLDILEDVGDRAMTYYSDQKLDALDDDALARRAKAMILLGRIDDIRLDIESAAKAFDEAERATGALLKRSPNNPDRVFDHAQSVFYVGETAMKRNKREKGEAKYQEYFRLAQRLVDLDPDNPRSQLEVAYATNNLGTLKHKAGDFAPAIQLFEKSVEARRRLVDQAPDDAKLKFAYAYAISWLAFAEMERGDFQRTVDLLDDQLAVYGPLADPASENFAVLAEAVIAHYRAAESSLYLDHIVAARAHLDAAKVLVDRLAARDSNNPRWAYSRLMTYRVEAFMHMMNGDIQSAIAAASMAVEIGRTIPAKSASSSEGFGLGLGSALALRLLLDPAHSQAFEDTAFLSDLVFRLSAADILENSNFFAFEIIALAEYERRLGRLDKQTEYLSAAIAKLDPIFSTLPARTKLILAEIYRQVGVPAKSYAILDYFDAQGFDGAALAAAQRKMFVQDQTLLTGQPPAISLPE